MGSSPNVSSTEHVYSFGRASLPNASESQRRLALLSTTRSATRARLLLAVRASPVEQGAVPSACGGVQDASIRHCGERACLAFHCRGPCYPSVQQCPCILSFPISPSLRLTTQTPPHPSEIASLAAQRRRIRSSITERSRLNFPRTQAIAFEFVMRESSQDLLETILVVRWRGNSR